MHLFDPKLIVETIGLFGTSAIVFAESGLFFGFFLPGDSLLFSAGLIASQGHISIIPLLFLVFISAVAGDNVGYFTGNKLGEKLFTKEDSWIFKKSYIHKTEIFFKKYGKKAIILARFIPIVRTFTPILAGAGKMEYRTFLSFNIIGGFLWTWGLTLAGYFLGSIFPATETYLTPIIFGIIILSFLPVLFETIKGQRS